MTVDIFDQDGRVGTITWTGSGFKTDPPDDGLLKNILEEPVFVSENGTLNDVYSHQQPATFMENLWKHYKSHALRAGQAREEKVYE